MPDQHELDEVKEVKDPMLTARLTIVGLVDKAKQPDVTKEERYEIKEKISLTALQALKENVKEGLPQSCLPMAEVLRAYSDGWVVDILGLVDKEMEPAVGISQAAEEKLTSETSVLLDYITAQLTKDGKNMALEAEVTPTVEKRGKLIVETMICIQFLTAVAEARQKNGQLNDKEIHGISETIRLLIPPTHHAFQDLSITQAETQA